ncbi:class I tRNA ligase family protein, partial [Candidatus Parcubacteria bacterium]|nr:class I tRNA ligase family protein [Candidatus Parcubacteria bacterium]
MKEIEKAYEPKKYEDKIYSAWEKSGFFSPDKLKDEPYSIMMPPPNVTGVLHLGHALENSLMDVMARYQRLRGKKVLLLPGTDHAAVATQAKVEKLLMEKGIKNPRQELGREKLLAEVRKYAEGSKKTILSQIRKMGTSCDWSRLAYTFDEDRNKAVNVIFKKMYDDGLIYRGFKAINWSTKGQSTLSDDEIVYKERKAKFYTFKYSKDFPITIATTRPETKLGDTAVAVNPKDPRYKKYIGKTFDIDFVGQKLKLKVIADRGVDIKLGTGALGVTPAHSLVDYEMGVKNDLEMVQVIGEDGKMTLEAGKFAGMSVEKAREEIVKKLKKAGLLKKEEEIDQNVGTSDRFGDIVEVLPKTQWFVAVNKKIPGRNKTLKELMKEAVGKTGVQITPKRFEKIYFNWINNLRDWCISRQIYWGHRIPVWYKDDKIKISDKSPGKGWTQDTDTLDTWFSSGLWTFSTLGWPLTKVIFVRHGQAEGNARGILDGHNDTEWNGLTEKGTKQVLKITGEIKKYGAVKIFSSPIKRTKETAKIIAKELGVEIEFDERIREIGVGKFQGESGDGFTKARTEFYNGGKNGHKIESLEDLEKRSTSFLKDLN